MINTCIHQTDRRSILLPWRTRRCILAYIRRTGDVYSHTSDGQEMYTRIHQTERRSYSHTPWRARSRILAYIRRTGNVSRIHLDGQGVEYSHTSDGQEMYTRMHLDGQGVEYSHTSDGQGVEYSHTSKDRRCILAFTLTGRE